MSMPQVGSMVTVGPACLGPPPGTALQGWATTSARVNIAPTAWVHGSKDPGQLPHAAGHAPVGYSRPPIVVSDLYPLCPYYLDPALPPRALVPVLPYVHCHLII